MKEKLLRLFKKNKTNANRVSAATGIPYTCIKDWEKGRCKPKTDKLKILADYFGVTIDYFLD